MKALIFASALLIPAVARKQSDTTWQSEKRQGYILKFTDPDQDTRKSYAEFVDKGIKEVNIFWNDKFKNEFEVFIHPDRKSLDIQWQTDWKMPEFKSECWMVASGVATKLDLISPAKWKTESCEHDYSDKTKTQRLITHELFHVFHGQQNASPDFSNTENIDWFVEGLATYASGQCDSTRMTEVKKAIKENTIPASLDQFWTGKLKYGLSGSVVMYLDKTYGRKKLKEIMPFNKKKEILRALNTTEENLIKEWKKFMEL